MHVAATPFNDRAQRQKCQIETNAGKRKKKEKKKGHLSFDSLPNDQPCKRRHGNALSKAWSPVSEVNIAIS